jgi:hypothetical protein
VKTTGDNPGWIWDHKAKLRIGAAGAQEIVVTGGKLYRMTSGNEEFLDNTATFVLDVATGVWSRTEI